MLLLDVDEVRSALDESRPNIQRFREIKRIIFKIVKEHPEINDFLGAIISFINKSEDIIEKTDLKIFINNFRKKCDLIYKVN